jgi:D-aminoacyl-tRNA deacylase
LRAVVQRVARAAVSLPQPDGAEAPVTGAIGTGLLVLVGVGHDDGEAEADWLARKIVGLRIFYDDDGKMNLDVRDVGGAVLAVSQFTLYGDCRKGRRPSFVRAGSPDIAEGLVEFFAARVRQLGPRCEMGRFGANMDVELLNQGPVTLLIDTEKTF